MIELPIGQPADLSPLTWLLGVWEGTGVIDYHAGGHHYSGQFSQRISFSHDGTPELNYASAAWMANGDVAGEGNADGAGADGQGRIRLLSELGFWRLARPQTAADPGPGLLPPAEVAAARTVDDVESLRNAEGGFDLEVTISRADGASELYLGQIKGPRIDIATDAVVRPGTAKDYSAASRMYGLVEGHLLWAWDIAALGAPLASHASARLAKVD